MDRLWFLALTAAGLAALWIAGSRALRQSGRGEKVCYTVVLVWCGYIILAKQLGFVPLTLANMNEVVFLPFGLWVDHMVMGPSGS